MLLNSRHRKPQEPRFARFERSQRSPRLRDRRSRAFVEARFTGRRTALLASRIPSGFSV